MSSRAITLRFASSEEVEISKKEAFRYMGIKAETLPDEMEELFGVCVSEFKKAVSYKACLAETEIRFFGNGRLDLGFGGKTKMKRFDQKTTQWIRSTGAKIIPCGKQTVFAVPEMYASKELFRLLENFIFLPH